MDFGHPAAAGGRPGHAVHGGGVPMFTADGAVMSPAEREAYCQKKGLCVTCGQRTHKISGPLRRKVPLTNANVRNGTCLICHPHLRPGGNSLPFSAGTADVVAVGPDDFSGGRGGGGGVGGGRTQDSALRGGTHWAGVRGATMAMGALSSGGGGGGGGSAQRAPQSEHDLAGMAADLTGQGGDSHSSQLAMNDMPNHDGGGRSASGRSLVGSSGDDSSGSNARRAISDGQGAVSSSSGASGGGSSSAAHSAEDALDEEYGWKLGRLDSNGVDGRRPSRLDPQDAWDVVKTMRDFPHDRALLSRQLHKLRAIGKNEVAAVYEVLEVMRRHPRDARLQAAACGAVWGVTTLDDDRKVEAVEAGAVEAVVHAVKGLPGDARLATWALGTLACLSHGVGTRPDMLEQGVLDDAIVPALNAQPRDSGVFEWAARALHGLVEVHADVADDADNEDLETERADTRTIVRACRSSGRLIPALLRAMRLNPDSFVAQEWSFRFLWILLTTDTTGSGGDEITGPEWREAEPVRAVLASIAEEDGLSVCMAVMRSRPTTERLQEMAFALMCAVLEPTWVNEDSADRVESVIHLMQEYPRNEWMQEEACALLSVWTTADDNHRTVLPGMGGLRAVLLAMENHPNAPALHESACHVLWSLSSAPSLWDRQLLADVVRRTGQSLAMHSGNVIVQARALGALSNLVLLEDLQEAGDEAVLIETVVAVLRSNQSHPEVAEGACRKLANSCHTDSFGRVAGEIVDADGVKAIVESMSSCASSTTVQEEGLAAMCGVLSSSHDEHRAAVIESGGIEAIRDAMTGHPSSLAAQLRGMYAICMVTLCKRCNESPVREGVIDAVVEAMDGPHQNSNELLTRSCLALRNFALAAANTGRTRRAAAVPSPGEAMEAVLRVLQRKGDNLILQKEACGALFALSTLCTDGERTPLNLAFREMIKILEDNKGDEVRPFNGSILGEALGSLENLTGLVAQEGGMSVSIHVTPEDIDIIIAVMYEALGQETPQPEIVEGVFGVLLNLSHEKAYEDAIIQCGGIVSIIDAMQENEANEAVESKGCAILSRLSADNLEVKLCIAETDGVEVIISAMLHNSTTADLQVQACRTLAHLTIDEESRNLITQQGGIVLILTAMANHRDNAELQETACEALCGLASDAHESVLSESNVVGAVIDTMRAHVDSPRVQERALGILQNLSMRSSGSKMSIASAGGIEEIILAIRENMTCSEVLERAFTALWSLAVLDGNQERIIAADGISTVINAMMASISFLAVQKQACGCLCTLSSNPRCKRLIKENGGLDAIVFAMWAHLNSESLLVEACRALSSLAVVSSELDGPDVANDGVVDTVILCMRRFADSVKLQEIACLALRNLSLSLSNLKLMKQKTGDLEKLLHKAAAKFPGECSQRANQVLTQLFD